MAQPQNADLTAGLGVDVPPEVEPAAAEVRDRLDEATDAAGRVSVDDALAAAVPTLAELVTGKAPAPPGPTLNERIRAQVRGGSRA
jgi:hypothetical protein